MCTMTKSKSSSYKWALGFVLTPMLVGASFGVYIVLTGIYTKIELNDGTFSLVDSVLLFLFFPILSGMVGLFFYFPPALVLASIAVAMHERKTLKNLMTLVISGGLLAGGWLFLLDDASKDNNAGSWGNYLCFIPGWKYAGPILVGAISTLFLELLGRYFSSEKNVKK